MFKKVVRVHGRRNNNFTATFTKCGQIYLSKRVFDGTSEVDRVEVFCDEKTKKVAFKFHNSKTAPKGCYKLFGRTSGKTCNRTISGYHLRSILKYSNNKTITAELEKGSAEGFDFVTKTGVE